MKNKIDILANVVASFVIISFSIYIGLAITNTFGAGLADIHVVWTGVYTFILIMSATKLYGTAIYNAVKAMGEGLLPTSSNNSVEK
jgi:hypothetical protein